MLKRFFNIKLALFVVMVELWACSQGNKDQLPVEFVWDRVACEECKMALSDRHYAAQVIDTRGKAYYFDDVGCALKWSWRQPGREKFRTWVNDVHTTEWINATEANWIYGDTRTPMGYGFAATLAPVEKSLNFETVNQWMAIGKTLVNENRNKHLARGTGHSQARKAGAGNQPVSDN